MIFALGPSFLSVTLMMAPGSSVAETKWKSASLPETTIRTETFPRPPYSGATYFLYERDGQLICTKLEVCNKFGNCEVRYEKGRFKAEEDVKTGDPYSTTAPVSIAADKLAKHACLRKFRLN